MVGIAECAICDKPFPTWSVSSKMSCYNHSALDSFSDILTLECEEDGTCIVGDYRTTAYGDGETPLEALRDYIVSLIDLIEIILKSQAGWEKIAIEEFVYRVCKRAEENMERTGKLEGSHYNAMLVELEKM